MTFPHAFVPILMDGTLVSECTATFILSMNSYTVLYCAPILMFGALLQNVQLIVIYLTTPHSWKLRIAATLDFSLLQGFFFWYLLDSHTYFAVVSWTSVLTLNLLLDLLDSYCH